MIGRLLSRLSPRAEHPGQQLVQQRGQRLQGNRIPRIAAGLDQDERDVRATETVHAPWREISAPGQGQVRGISRVETPAPLCTCGHRMVFHGDRAVAACDGGYAGTRPSPSGLVTLARSGPHTLCHCPGWERADA